MRDGSRRLLGRHGCSGDLGVAASLAKTYAYYAAKSGDTTAQTQAQNIIDVIHQFYGGMPREKAEKSLRLFAEKVLPAVHAMDTPLNPASLG